MKQDQKTLSLVTADSIHFTNMSFLGKGLIQKEVSENLADGVQALGVF